MPAPDTIYQGIHKLPPAHLLVAERGRVRISRYWDLEFTGDGDARREDDYLAELDDLLREAVRLRLVSDVPLGAFLSGGIDSSAVVAYMVETSAAPPITISVGFEQQAFDEVRHAETVARHLGCDFHALTASPMVEDLLPKLAWHFDEPFADSSAVPTYYVSKAARELVTVALSGDGGDELWAGYARHPVEHWEQRARTALGPAAPAAAMLGRALPLSVKGARSLRHLAFAPDQAYALKHAYGMFETDVKARLYSDDFRRSINGYDPFARFRDRYRACTSDDPLDRAMYVDANTYMIDDVLTKVDRMSMAVSLEAREPLLDHKLLEFAARVPSSLKLKNGRGKYLLRRALERRVPRAITERGKSGFAAPIGEWLRGPLAADDHRAAAGRPAARARHLQPRRSHAALGRASPGPPRPSPPPLAARHARAVVQAVHRRKRQPAGRPRPGRRRARGGSGAGRRGRRGLKGFHRNVRDCGNCCGGPAPP